MVILYSYLRSLCGDDCISGHRFLTVAQTNEKRKEQRKESAKRFSLDQFVVLMPHPECVPS